MKNCHNCKNDNPLDSSFCLECGVELDNNPDSKKTENNINGDITRVDERPSKKVSRAKTSALKTDQIIAGKYRLIEKIGEGGIGQVWKAEDTILDRVVALKRLKIKFSSSPVAYHRFIREAKVLSKLNHANILSIYDLVEESGRNTVYY